jgi:NADH-quinone oxidoreductase subunit N
MARSFQIWCLLDKKIIVLCSFGSMIVACFGGLYQRRLKRLFAYSSIGHGGYMLIGLSTGLIEGFQGVLVYIAIYIFMTLGVFCIILSTRKQSDGYRVKYLTDYTSLAYTNSTLAIAFCMILFSMIGVPPLAGFYGKFSVFLAGMKSSLYTLAIIGVASSVVSSAYYIRMIKLMYIDKCPKVL